LISSSESEDAFSEFRRRVFTCAFEGVCDLSSSDAVDMQSNVSTQLPSSMVDGSSLTIPDTTRNCIRSPADREAFVESRSSKWRCASWASASDEPCEDEVTGTTMMFRNLPEYFSRNMLEGLLDIEGFAKQYDFIYLPADLATGACFGYAFVNLVTTKCAQRFLHHFQGFERWPEPSAKRAMVHMSEGIQGKGEQVERYRNSPLMHPNVSDGLRPAIYNEGVREAFPEPLVPLKPPRMRANAKRNQGSTQKMAQTSEP